MTNSPTNKSQAYKIVFSERSGSFIGEILEKYGLNKQQEEGLDRLFKSSAGEKEKILRELPGPKIVLLLREYQEKKVKLEEFPTILQEALKVSAKDAKAIAEELQKKVIIFQSLPEKNIISPSEAKPVKPTSSDTYREPIG